SQNAGHARSLVKSHQQHIGAALIFDTRFSGGEANTGYGRQVRIGFWGKGGNRMGGHGLNLGRANRSIRTDVPESAGRRKRHARRRRANRCPGDPDTLPPEALIGDRSGFTSGGRGGDGFGMPDGQAWLGLRPAMKVPKRLLMKGTTPSTMVADIKGTRTDRKST